MTPAVAAQWRPVLFYFKSLKFLQVISRLLPPGLSILMVHQDETLLLFRLFEGI